MNRAASILSSAKDEFADADYYMPVPSSAPFCGKFAALIASTLEKPILEPTFIRKKTIGEVLAENKENPPKVRPALKVAYTSQLSALEIADPHIEWQAKEVDLSIRHLFHPFIVHGEVPTLRDKKIVLVDDLFATGSSILSIREIVTNQLGASVKAICFLSGAQKP